MLVDQRGSVFKSPRMCEVARTGLYSHIPVLLLARHEDGSRRAFYGCFLTRHPPLEMLGVPHVSEIVDAHILKAKRPNAHLLLDACQPRE